MITKDNLQFYLNSLNKKEINRAFDSNKDYLLFWLHIFNTGSYATLDAMDYSEAEKERALSCGQIFCSKEQFLQLFAESGSTNPHLIELT